MLTISDENIIRTAIQRRLGKEKGIGIADILVVPLPHLNCIRVGILFTKDVQSHDSKLICRSLFELPTEFTHAHLIAEIDEICEGAKAARKDFGISGAII